MEAYEKARQILARHRNYQSSNPEFQQMLDDCFVFAFTRGETWVEEIHCEKIGEQIMKTIEERAKEFATRNLCNSDDEVIDSFIDVEIKNIYEQAATEQARIDAELYTNIIKSLQRTSIEALKIAKNDAILKMAEETQEGFVPDLTEDTANEMIDVLNGLINTRNPEPEQITMEWLQKHGFEKNDHRNGFVDLIKTLHIEKDESRIGKLGHGKLGARKIRITFFKDCEGVEHIVCRLSGRMKRIFEGEIKNIQELHAALDCVGLPEVSIELMNELA